MKTHAFVLLSVVLLSSCSHYVVNDEGYIRPPAGYKFSYRKKASQLSSTEIIDTTAYIRFYADSRFKLKGDQKRLEARKFMAT